MDEQQKPPAFPESPKTETEPTVVEGTTLRSNTSERYLVPTAVGLGLLLIVGGIILLGVNRNRKQIATLPDYSPVITTPVTSPSPTPSLEASSSPTPTPAQVASNTGTTTQKQPATTATKKTITQTTKTATTGTKALPAYNPASSLPEYSPANTSNLPEYQPATALPDYQPQYVTPTPTPSPVKQTVSVTLSVPGKSYALEVSPDSTVLQAMQAARAQGFSFTTENFSGFGEKVTEINGQHENGSHYWLYKINGQFANYGISTQKLKAGDTISWSLS